MNRSWRYAVLVQKLSIWQENLVCEPSTYTRDFPCTGVKKPFGCNEQI